MRSRARRGDFAGAGLTPSGDVQRRGQASAERRDGGAARRRGVGSESALSEAEGVPMYERHSACVSAHVDARVTAVRARVIHAEGDAPSARRARPVRRLWIDAACVGGVGGCSIDFARAPASRGCVQPAIAPGEFLRDGEEARARPGTPPMHHPPAGAAGARRAQNSPCNARARAASAWLGARAWVVARRVPNGACIRARSRPRGALQSEPLLAPIGLHERGLQKFLRMNKGAGDRLVAEPGRLLQ